MIKNVLLMCALFISASLYADSVGSVAVTTNSTIILPYANASSLSLSAWVSGTTYDQGDYVRVGSARYWTPNGGTSTNQPAHIEGQNTYADGVTWQRITNDGRRVAWITNNGSTAIWLSFGVDAEVGKGLPLNQDEKYGYEGQYEVSAISSVGGISVSTSEEDE